MVGSDATNIITSVWGRHVRFGRRVIVLAYDELSPWGPRWGPSSEGRTQCSTLLVGLPFKCHQGRWPRSVVAGVWNEVRQSGTHAPNFFRDWLRHVHWKEALVVVNTMHVYVKDAEWEFIYRIVMDGKVSETECAIILRGLSLELEVCKKERAKRFPTAPTHREIRGVISDWAYDRVRPKLVVEPPVTVDLSFCLVPFMTSLTSLFSSSSFSAAELTMKTVLVSSQMALSFVILHLFFKKKNFTWYGLHLLIHLSLEKKSDGSVKRWSDFEHTGKGNPMYMNAPLGLWRSHWRRRCAFQKMQWKCWDEQSPSCLKIQCFIWRAHSLHLPFGLFIGLWRFSYGCWWA